MPNQDVALDRVFQALADPTRRAVLRRLSSGVAPVTELAAPFDMALPSFLQHLKVLETCGLVRSHKSGRVRTYRISPEPLKTAEGWMSEQRALWERRLDQLDRYLATLKPEHLKPTMKRKKEKKMTIDPKLDLVLERVVDVSPELVWMAWTQPEHLKKWFTPVPWKTVECEIDLREGGLFRTVMRSPEGEDHPNIGCYLEVVPGRKLVWTDALEAGFRPSRLAAHLGFRFTAAVMIEPQGRGTKYTAIVMHGDEASRKKHDEMGFADGWGTTLEQLVAHMKTVRP